MGIWAWVAGIIAGVAIIFLVAYGDDDRTFAGRDREGLSERNAQSLEAAPVSVGTDVTLDIAVADSVTPPEVKSSLEQVQQLLATAAGQEGDEAKTTLQQAQETLGGAIDATNDVIGDTSNDATKYRLLTLVHLLERIETVIQTRLEQL
jgi:hypothetical protein